MKMRKAAIASYEKNEAPVADVVLKKGRERAVVRRHPWIYSGSIARIVGNDPEPGDLVNIVAADGRWLATAYYNPLSQIRARILSWDEDETINTTFWESRLERAISRRKDLSLEPDTTAYRLINAEADLVPGLIADRYEQFLVIQCLSFGIERRKGTLVHVLSALLSPEAIIERSDLDVRSKEGLPPVVEMLSGQYPSSTIVVRENRKRFEADLVRGHKTGLYLDQRENRSEVCQPEFVTGCEILNVFSYTGGFAVYAAAEDAKSITNVDNSASALEQAKRNMELNDYHRPKDEYILGNAFRVLRRLREKGRKFDMVILDPPKFAHSQRDVRAACRGYKDLNLQALRLLRPNGRLATFSCSGLVSADLFQKVLFGASVDAGRDIQVIAQLGQAADHPVLLTFPQSGYLKGFLCRVI